MADLLERKFKIVTKDIQNLHPYFGVIKDCVVDEREKTYNYGAATSMWVGCYGNGGGTRQESNVLLDIQMPESGDVDGFGELWKVELLLYITSASYVDGTYQIIGIVEFDDEFTEGSGGDAGGAGVCNWEYRMLVLNWTRADGAIYSGLGTDDKDGEVYHPRNLGSASHSIWADFDITKLVSMGSNVKLAIFTIETDTGTDVGDMTSNSFASKEHGTSSLRPKLRIHFKDYAVEAFTDKDAALSIEPNPNNPEQPLLKWGGVKDADFVHFRLFRETSPITSVAALTEIATITSPANQEYIDDDTLTDGQKYYYLVIAEDGNNTVDDATLSNQIEWTKPNMSARTISTTGSSPIGTTKTVSVTSGNNIKKLYVDWEDGCTSWYEYETVGLTKTATHIYTQVLGTVGSQFAPEVRVEDADGFWSSQLDTTTTIYTTGSDSSPKLRVSVKKGLLGDYVTLDASLSQPNASNVTLTKYEFKRDASDGWQNNGANPIYTFKTGTGGGEYPQSIGVKTASLRTTTSLGTVSSTTSATYELETGTSTLLTFSSDCKIHEIPHDLSLDKMVEVPIGSDRVAHEFLISRPPERITLVGTSNHPNVVNDVTTIRNAWLNNTFIKFVITTEMEGKTVTYEGKIDGDISLGQAYDNKQSFSFPLRVITRTVTGIITGFANGGSGSVIVTSTKHALSVGNTITISGTTNYNGTFTITAITKDTFKITTAWISDDGTGIWEWDGA